MNTPEKSSSAAGSAGADTTDPSIAPADMHRAPLVQWYLSVLVIATCGLIYELLAGTLASYVLGDSVRQFSLVIGVYLSALGAGAWVSRFVDRKVARTFVEVELAVALLGGLSAPILFVAFAHVSWFQTLLLSMVFVIGLLVGLELPLLMRILEKHLDFKELVSRVLTFDYIGALAASVLFPILLVPKLGLVRTSLAFGILNALVGLWSTWLLAPLLGRRLLPLRLRALVVIGLLVAAYTQADRLTYWAEAPLFQHPIVHAETTPYQRIVVTRGPHDFQLFLNGNLQFHSADEYRYHEALVHPVCLSVSQPRDVLVLGGGDGLAVREILKHPTVRSVTMVDLDPAMTTLAERLPLLAELNGRAMSDPRVTVVNEDAFVWIARPGSSYDVAIVDFPDPNTYSLGKLYTTRFYRLLRERIRPGGAVAIQSTSPLLAPRSYWCIARTLEAAEFSILPYHATVPSFGVWGYVLAGREPLAPPRRVPTYLSERLRFLDDDVLAALFLLPPDMHSQPVEVNRLDSQMLVRYYDEESNRWN